MKLILRLLFCIFISPVFTVPLFAMQKQTPLEQAIEQDNAILVIKLLKKLCTQIPTREAKQNLQNSLLKIAYRDGKENTIMALIRNGADPNIVVDETGTTILMGSVANPLIFDFLINNGADPHRYNHDGQSALHYCVIPGGERALHAAQRLLNLVGVDYPHRQTKQTLLAYAARVTDRCQLMALLLDNHADPDNNQAERIIWPDQLWAPLTYALLGMEAGQSGKYKQECPFKTALLLYTYGGTSIRCDLKNYFSRTQIKLMTRERERRIADCAFLAKLNSADILRLQPFSQLYNQTQRNIISSAVRTTRSSQNIALIADYAAYDPVGDNYARDPELAAPNRSCREEFCSVQ